MLITRRHLIDRLRRKAVRPSFTHFDADFGGQSNDPKPEDAGVQEDVSTELRSRIAELPELQQELMVLLLKLVL